MKHHLSQNVKTPWLCMSYFHFSGLMWGLFHLFVIAFFLGEKHPLIILFSPLDNMWDLPDIFISRWFVHLWIQFKSCIILVTSYSSVGYLFCSFFSSIVRLPLHISCVWDTSEQSSQGQSICANGEIIIIIEQLLASSYFRFTTKTQQGVISLSFVLYSLFSPSHVLARP